MPSFHLPLPHLYLPSPHPSSSGSGSTYIYGYCDAHFKEGMTKGECIDFVKNCKTIPPSHHLLIVSVALTHLGDLLWLHQEGNLIW